MMLRDPPHYLKALISTTTPRRLLWLDCQAQTAREHGVTVDRWAGGALGRTWWTSKTGTRRDDMEVFTEPADLWAAAQVFARPGKRAVLWAYDLAYQLRVSQALVHLPAMGWRLDRIVLERTAAWALLRNGKRTILFCDLKSWAPVELHQLQTDVEASHPPAMRRCSVNEAGWPGCVARLEVVRAAVLEILAWVEGEGLGPFRPTGSGQSYAAFRRRFLTDKLLVHDDIPRLALERTAMWTGRCEAWKHGTHPEGPFTEYDLTAAYCNIVAECEVPALAGQIMERPSAARLQKAMELGAVLAEVEVTTDVPCLPARLGERTAWPVGRFKTVLWDPELRLALRYCHEVKVTRAFTYRTAPALQAFSQWVLDGLTGQTQVYGLVPGRVLKHWSRCLVGRLGLRYRQWQRFGNQPEQGLQLVTFLDCDEGTATDMLIAGTDRLILTGMTEALDSLPQVPGWVMSECRARLWEAMMRAGLSHVLYVDTDSIILGPGAHILGRTPLTNGNSHGWAVKGRYSRVSIYGPRNLTTETGRRVSGLPLSARQVAPLEFTGQVMRSIKDSMRTGELDHVASIPRRFVLDAPDLRREHLPNGQTAPYRLELLDASSQADL